MTDRTPPHISRVRGQIGAAAASTSDLLDLLTAGLAADNQSPPAAQDHNARDDEAADSQARDGGGHR